MTKAQRKMLTAYKAFRDSPPTVLTLLPRFLRPWLLLTVVCGVLVALGVVNGFLFVPRLAVGLLVGCVARDIGWSLKTVSGWPTTREVINWDRVEQLLSQDPTNPN
ncbi:MAG TPA: hypothetical protein VFV87_04385 [Pirellulaceae bacterium]|nr:hypothetical protein [Pirellulaceae bacterium]